MSGWIGVDLDGTLAKYASGSTIDTIGEPVPLMVARVKDWRSRGIEVRIFTARVGACGASNSDGVCDSNDFAAEQRDLIGRWCLRHLGEVLPITATKDFMMVELWDDRAIRVEMNTGRAIDAR